MTRKITIQDVADHAGVSMMTVSRVLNHGSNVKQATKERIERAVNELGYKPNFSARRLSSGRNYFIGVLCYRPNSAYVSQFLFGCIRYCGEIGYHLIVEEMSEDNDESDTINSLCKDVDGMILLPPLSEDDNILRELNKQSIPYVRIGQQCAGIPAKNVSYVAINDYQASLDLTSHLIEQGHRKIGYITGDQNQQVSMFRFNGYRDALLKHQIEFDSDYLVEGDFSYKSALNAAEELMTLAEPPSAIFACNDEMAAAVLAAAHKHNLNVPDDISIVGFDDTTVATMIWPQLTTVRQPLQQMAVTSIEQLLGKNRHSVISLPFEIIYRDSVSAKKEIT